MWAAIGCANTTAKSKPALWMLGWPATPKACVDSTSQLSIRCCGPGQCQSVCHNNRSMTPLPPKVTTDDLLPRQPHVWGWWSSHSEAKTECAARGLRLCSRTELHRNKCCRAGCNMDPLLVWTSEPCSEQECINCRRPVARVAHTTSKDGCTEGDEFTWWTPREQCRPYEAASSSQGQSTNLLVAPPCADGDVGLAMSFPTILRCGAGGSRLRYFNRSMVLQCFDSLGARGSAPISSEGGRGGEWVPAKERRVGEDGCGVARGAGWGGRWGVGDGGDAGRVEGGEVGLLGTRRRGIRLLLVGPSTLFPIYRALTYQLNVSAQGSSTWQQEDVWTEASNAEKQKNWHKRCHIATKFLSAKHTAAPVTHEIAYERLSFLSDRRTEMSRVAPYQLYGNRVIHSRDNCVNVSSALSTADIVAIQVGAWDATWGSSADSFETRLEELVANYRLQFPRTRVVLITQTPCGGPNRGEACGPFYRSPRSLYDATMELNRRIRNLAKRHCLPLLDAMSMVASHPDRDKPSMWEGGSGWHMNEPSIISHAIAMRLLNMLCPGG